MYRYEIQCDRCGIKLQDTTFSTLNPTDEVRKNMWRISIDSHWLDDTEDRVLQEWKRQVEMDLEVCMDCAKLIASELKKLLNADR